MLVYYINIMMQGWKKNRELNNRRSELSNNVFNNINRDLLKLVTQKAYDTVNKIDEKDIIFDDFSSNMELIVKDIMKKLANEYTHIPTVNETIESLDEYTADAVIQIIKNNEYNDTHNTGIDDFNEDYTHIIQNNLNETLLKFINHVINKLIEHKDVKQTLKIPLQNQNNRKKVVDIIVEKSLPEQQGGKKTKKSKKNKKNKKNKKTKKRRRRR